MLPDPAAEDQLEPSEETCHWRDCTVGVGVPVQVPSLPDRIPPTAAVPVTTGRTVFLVASVTKAVVDE